MSVDIIPQSVDYFTLSTENVSFTTDILTGEMQTYSPRREPIEVMKVITTAIGFVAYTVSAITLALNGDGFSFAILFLFRHQSVVILCGTTGLLILLPLCGSLVYTI